MRSSVKGMKKYPWIALVLSMFIIAGIGMLIVSMLCNTGYPCTQNQIQYTLLFGLNVCLLITVFIIIPILLRSILNCFWKEEVLPVTRPTVQISPVMRVRSSKNSPLRTIDSPLRVKRSHSATT